ncbi:GATA zinc finger domain-containing protein 14-like [Mizuhopecten yessoensis]|uniref:Uncharacterized protein n=1 Tax=Mizuhopecten yessoensis TaxID=6573 RepID=A0A210QLF4_MIZYE|nr:GATA zinc finger domain-containing protein 14-like [Mizuhopecten yessoensis]XP_021355460.1 GATA zinc finger domain-containing protein 14-like [Mizuhopecten yessoensis]XP_021355461.1 GATA zinc finger domain-containing protein 14-like [Mizuhopecten yessoensis]OWF49567.1 hypothetical protein KP79_PYT23743 [Mizuhopecten yessoensis]
MGTTQFLLLSAFVCFTTEAPYPKTGLVLLRNKRNVKSRAELRSCARHNCSNSACPNEDGWHLYGSDWGCCGNYDGCCTWASVVCYAHDVICQCCDYGWWCGPECRREPECFLPGRKIPNPFEGLDHSAVNEIPNSMPKKGYPTNKNGSGHKIVQEKRNNSEHNNTILNKRFTFKSAIENTEEYISENIEQLPSNETENDFYVQNMTQKLNYSNFLNEDRGNSSLTKEFDTGHTSGDTSDNSIGNVTQDAINETTHTMDKHDKTEISRYQFHNITKSGKTAKHNDGRLLNNSLETIEEMEEAYDTINHTRKTNITGGDDDYNSTTTESQTAGDNSIAGEQIPEVEGNDNREDTDSEDLFQNVIHVARMSSASSEVPDPEQDSVGEEDGSGEL